jgi:hypothetical protein
MEVEPMTGRGLRRTIVPLALLLTASMALAQPLQPKTVNGVRYFCGGVGLDESGYLKQEAARGGLLLTFAARDGSYLASVHVDISDGQGKPVLQADCDGPMMLVDLPGKGSYRIRAEHRGKTLTRSVAAGGKGGMRAVFVWPAGDNGGGDGGRSHDAAGEGEKGAGGEGGKGEGDGGK